MRAIASKTLFVVQADPPAAREAEFQHWYDQIHWPDAFANGSFTGLKRYRAVGPGRPFAPFLALWAGDYADEAAAWGYIRPRAHALHSAGRVDDISSVKFALMTFRVHGAGEGRLRATPRCLTTVQNDWRDAASTPKAEIWGREAGLDSAPASLSQSLYTSDPAGRASGYHLALFEQDCTPAEAAIRWSGFGEAGSSPTPPYRTIFADPDAPVAAVADEAPRAHAWVMHWEPIAVLGDPDGGA